MNQEQTLTSIREAWNTALGKETPLSDKALNLIIRRYQEKGRHYHTLEHITSCLQELEREGITDPESVLSIIGHDYIYQVNRKDNEERSAKHVGTILSILHQEETLITTIQEHIIATKHQKPPRNQQEALILDADMSILGQPWETFLRYDEAILKEYFVFPQELFKQGRKQFLEQLLQQQALYYTKAFKTRYEEHARKNMEEY